MDSPHPYKGAARLLGLVLALLAPALSPAAPVPLEVRDPYVELHTGPGRGYPVFYAVERGATIEIGHRRTDWYKVTADATVGWVHRDDLRQTLAAAGVDPGLRAALLDRHVEGRLSAGMSAGSFEGDAVIDFWGSYRITPKWAAQLSVAQAGGDFSSTRMIRLEARHQPWPEQRFPLHASLGLGWFQNVPRQTLVEDVEENTAAVSLGLGVSKQLEPRFGLRADWRWHHARFDGDSEDFHELTAGFVLLF